MNISYNWLKNYIATDLPAEKIAEILTDIGLEVESFEKVETVRGGLSGGAGQGRLTHQRRIRTQAHRSRAVPHRTGRLGKGMDSSWLAALNGNRSGARAYGHVSRPGT